MRRIMKITEATEHDDGLFICQTVTEMKDGVIYVLSCSFMKVDRPLPREGFGRGLQDSLPSQDDPPQG